MQLSVLAYAQRATADLRLLVARLGKGTLACGTIAAVLGCRQRRCEDGLSLLHWHRQS
jgi:hypothetical protein